MGGAKGKRGENKGKGAEPKTAAHLSIKLFLLVPFLEWEKNCTKAGKPPTCHWGGGSGHHGNPGRPSFVPPVLKFFTPATHDDGQWG